MSTNMELNDIVKADTCLIACPDTKCLFCLEHDLLQHNAKDIFLHTVHLRGMNINLISLHTLAFASACHKKPPFDQACCSSLPGSHKVSLGRFAGQQAGPRYRYR